MNTRDFFFELPERLIAQRPPAERGKSRLMLLDTKTGERRHAVMEDAPAIFSGPAFRSASGLPPLLVFNNSPVRKARLQAVAASMPAGAAAEFLLTDRLDARVWRVLSEKSKRKKEGSRYRFAEGLGAEILKDGAGLYLRFDEPLDEDWLERNGRVPLPPYIRRPDEPADAASYQTVYADRKAAPDVGPGASAAAPTAGLHWTPALLAALEAAGIGTAFVTLHVGPGTFLPVRSERVEDHRMHEESYRVSAEAARAINGARAAGRKIVAVGTTSARTLEAASMPIQNAGRFGHDPGPPSMAAREGGVRAGEGATALFIYPGYRFRAIDALFTNFHTPCSSLLMLAAAFAGREGGRALLLESYAEAAREGYRFFSYGDAMLLY